MKAKRGDMAFTCKHVSAKHKNPYKHVLSAVTELYRGKAKEPPHFIERYNFIVRRIVPLALTISVQLYHSPPELLPLAVKLAKFPYIKTFTQANSADDLLGKTQEKWRDWWYGQSRYRYRPDQAEDILTFAKNLFGDPGDLRDLAGKDHVRMAMLLLELSPIAMINKDPIKAVEELQQMFEANPNIFIETAIALDVL